MVCQAFSKQKWGSKKSMQGLIHTIKDEVPKKYYMVQFSKAIYKFSEKWIH